MEKIILFIISIIIVLFTVVVAGNMVMLVYWLKHGILTPAEKKTETAVGKIINK